MPDDLLIKSKNRLLADMDLLKKYGVIFQPNVVVIAANLGTVKETVQFLQSGSTQAERRSC